MRLHEVVGRPLSLSNQDSQDEAEEEVTSASTIHRLLGYRAQRARWGAGLSRGFSGERVY